MTDGLGASMPLSFPPGFGSTPQLTAAGTYADPIIATLTSVGKLCRELQTVRAKARPVLFEACAAQTRARAMAHDPYFSGTILPRPEDVEAWLAAHIRRVAATSKDVLYRVDDEVGSTSTVRDGLTGAGYPVTTQALAVLRSAFRMRPEYVRENPFALKHAIDYARVQEAAGVHLASATRAAGGDKDGHAAILISPMARFLTCEDPTAVAMLARIDELASNRSGRAARTGAMSSSMRSAVGGPSATYNPSATYGGSGSVYGSVPMGGSMVMPGTPGAFAMPAPPPMTMYQSAAPMPDPRLTALHPYGGAAPTPGGAVSSAASGLYSAALLTPGRPSVPMGAAYPLAPSHDGPFSPYATPSRRSGYPTGAGPAVPAGFSPLTTSVPAAGLTSHAPTPVPHSVGEFLRTAATPGERDNLMLLLQALAETQSRLGVPQPPPGSAAALSGGDGTDSLVLHLGPKLRAGIRFFV
jgi:hypothetical protein